MDRQLNSPVEDEVDSRAASNKENNNRLYYGEPEDLVKSPKELLGEEFTSIAEYNAHLARHFRQQEQTNPDDTDCDCHKYRMEKLGEKQWTLYCDNRGANWDREWRLVFDENEDEENGLRELRENWEKKLNFKYADDSDDDSIPDPKAKHVSMAMFNGSRRDPWRANSPANKLAAQTTVLLGDSGSKKIEVNHNMPEKPLKSEKEIVETIEKIAANDVNQGVVITNGPSGSADDVVEEKTIHTDTKKGKTPVKRTDSNKSSHGGSRTSLNRAGSKSSIGPSSPGVQRKSSKYTTTVEIMIDSKNGAAARGAKEENMSRPVNTGARRKTTGCFKKSSSPTQTSKSSRESRLQSSTRESRVQSAKNDKHSRTGSMSPPTVSNRKAVSASGVRSRSVGPNVLLQNASDKTVSVREKKAAWEAKSVSKSKTESSTPEQGSRMLRKSSEKRKSIIAERKAMLFSNVTTDTDKQTTVTSRKSTGSASTGKTGNPEMRVRRSLPPTPVKTDGPGTFARTPSRYTPALLKSEHSPGTKSSSATKSTSLSASGGRTETTPHQRASRLSSSGSPVGSHRNSPTSKSAPSSALRKSDDKPTSMRHSTKTVPQGTKRKTPPPVPAKPEIKGVKRDSPSKHVDAKVKTRKTPPPASPIIDDKVKDSEKPEKKNLPEAKEDLGHVETDSARKPTKKSETSPSKVEKDGNYFLNVVNGEEDRLNKLCKVAEGDLQNNDLSEEMSGKVRAAIGKAQLLTTKKFKQFKGLCHQNLSPDPSTSLKTTSSDLAGFWDMVMIQVDDVNRLFEEIDQLRQNGWKSPTKQTLVKKKVTKSTKKPMTDNNATKTTAKKTPASKAKEAREEARKRLIAAKRAAIKKQQENAENDVQIFIHTDER